MTHRFGSFDEYFAGDSPVSVQATDVGSIVVSRLAEGSNDISVASVAKDAVLVSLSGSEHHRMGFAGVRREAPTAVRDVALVPRGAALESSWRVRGRPLRTLSLEFDACLFHRYAPEVVTARSAEGHLKPATYGARTNLSDIAMLLARETEATARGRLFADSLNRLIAMELAASCWSVPAGRTVRPLRPDRRVQRAIDYIEARFAENISMLDIAAAAGLGISTLTAQFRRATGLSPYAFVIERRVAQAERMLRLSDMPIAEVALAAGFADQAHLTRLLRARRGTTPRQVRLAAVPGPFA